MARYLIAALAFLLLTGCKKEKEEEISIESPGNASVLEFRPVTYSKKSTVCKKECTYVDIKVPEAVHGNPVIADSINKALFRVARSIVYFGEKPTKAANYQELMDSFIASYDNLARRFPEEAQWAWEAKINATLEYQSDNILNFKVNNYMFTGGAHGYEGNRSVILDAKTGKALTRSDILQDERGFTSYAEGIFRKQYNIPPGKPINSTGLMFPKNTFILPENIFFNDNGIVLLYNPAEIGSFADGPKQVVVSFEEANRFLKARRRF
jgi:hypothetical protein